MESGEFWIELLVAVEDNGEFVYTSKNVISNKRKM